MRTPFSRTALSLLFLTASTTAFAQGWPLPGKTQNVEVTCHSCTSSSPPADGKTVGYTGPITSFTGRFLDSQATNEIQQTFRTARAGKFVVSPDGKRLYIQMGSMVAAYDMATFFTRLAGSEPLMRATDVPLSVLNTRVQGTTEVFLRPDRFFYAEWGSGWTTPFVDGVARLNDFDVDDQGYVYMSHYVFGWGIAKDDGGTDGTLKRMPSVYQHFPFGDNNDQDPVHIISFRSGGDYFVLVNATSQSEVWKVTDRTKPVRVATLKSLNFAQAAKNTAGDRIAILDGAAGTIHVYAADALAAGAGPMATFSAGFPYSYSSVTSDGTNFIASFKKPTLRFASFIPSGASYVQAATFDTGSFADTSGIRASNGYLSVLTSDGLLLYKSTPDANFFEVPLRSSYSGSNVKSDSYFSQYYFNAAPPGYGYPHFYVHSTDAAVLTSGDKSYILYSAGGLGDVYGLTGNTLPALCEDPTNVCLNGGRFAVHIEWTTSSGSGAATPVKYSDASALFWFFGSDNLEVLLKVLNGCALNNHYWVFAAAATDTEYRIIVTDTLTGRVKTYIHHGGSASPAITDTGALPCS